MQIEIKKHEQLKTERATLMEEAAKLLTKIIKLNKLYNGRINRIKNKIEAIEKQL